MPFWSHFWSRAGRRPAAAFEFPTVQRARKQAADRRGPDASGDGDVAIAQVLRAEREQETVAVGQVAERVTRCPQLPVFIRQFDRRDLPIVRRRPRNPPGTPPLTVARRVSRHGEEPSPQVAGVTPGVEMAQELQKCFLKHIFRILVVAEEGRREPIHCRAVLFEQVLCRQRRVGVRGHLFGCHRYNVAACRL